MTHRLAWQVSRNTKRFPPGVRALDPVDIFPLSASEKESQRPHGENGAGKSTLIKVLTGVLFLATTEPER